MFGSTCSQYPYFPEYFTTSNPTTQVPDPASFIILSGDASKGKAADVEDRYRGIPSAISKERPSTNARYIRLCSEKIEKLTLDPSAIQNQLSANQADAVFHLFQNPPQLLVARPLKELSLHVQNFRVPRLELLVRAVKVLALALFRWHLCDELLVLRQGEKSEENCLHHALTPTRQTVGTNPFDLQFDECYPYLIKAACRYEKKTEGLACSQSFTNPLSPDTVVSYFARVYTLENEVVTGKAEGNTLYDLFQSKFFRPAKEE